ncbi:MAG TPA: serine/threonine-protein kinase [Terriglobales bacterium]|nr:serine/threonine-protein kinase [Terriglobales bacterium]
MSDLQESSVTNSERWERTKQLLEEALRLAPDQRPAFLDCACGADAELRAEVESLVVAHEQAGSQFLNPAAAETINVTVDPFPAPLNEVIGHYRLIEQLGHGGMGVVYKAEDTRLHRFVALKFPNAALVGRVGAERFRREGTILARLTHPHIARLIDAGVSTLGQPYLVLEHVEGEHIDRYCDARSLTIEARLRLFLNVLAAVSHAHANLIVHRDIKPSNVLVTPEGQVKLLDFGIAKLLEDDTRPGLATVLTREGGWVLTPEYAAPEQVTSGPITTATDVYSLGVLLYLLLSGQHPAGSGMHSSAELLKALVEIDPERLSDSAAGKRKLMPETTAENAARRGTTSDKLCRTLRGDLDTIVAKALKKRQQERYVSAAALADDLRRHLEHLPISARPDTLAYRAAKFARRNRTAVSLASLAVVALAVGLVGTVTQRNRAEKAALVASAQRDFALRQLSRAEAINDLNAFLLSGAAPSGKPFTVGKLLANAEHVVNRQYGETDENRVEMLIAIGRQYQTNEEDARALPLLAKAHELAQKTSDRALRGKAACALATTSAHTGEFQRAEQLISTALNGLPYEPQFALHRIFCLLRGSEVSREAGNVQLGLERAQAAQRVLGQAPFASAAVDLQVSMDLAEAYRMAGRHREANSAFREVAAKLQALGRDDTETAGTVLNNWGLVVNRLGRQLEAEQLFRRAIAISRADRTERSVAPMLLNNLARTLLELNRFSEAADYAERAYAKARQAGDEIVMNQALSVRFQIYIDQGDVLRAAQALAELQPRWKRMMPPGHIAFAILPLYQGLLAMKRGDRETAIAKADRAVALAEANRENLTYLSMAFLLRRAEVNLTFQRLDETKDDAEKARAIEQTAFSEGPSSRVGSAYLMEARALRAQGKFNEARVAARSALEHLEPTVGADHPKSKLARTLAGE